MTRNGLRSMTTKRRARERQLANSRRVVLLRSGGQCEGRVADTCTGVGIHAHHRRMRSQGGSNEPENLAWLCLPCHAHVHANPEQSYELGLLLHSWDGGAA